MEKRLLLIWILMTIGGPLRAAAGSINPVFPLLNTNAARVVIVEDREAFAGLTPRIEAIRRMVDHGLTNLTRTADPRLAWRTLVSTQEVVGLKVLATPGALSGTRPAVAEAVCASLLSAGIPATNIVIWDKQLEYLQLAGFDALAERLGVRLESSVRNGYDTNYFYESSFLGQPVWGDLEFGEKGQGIGRRSYVTRLVTRRLDKIINLTPLLNHNLIGVSGNLFSLTMGSVDNTARFLNQADQLAVAVPEIYALEILGDRVVLNIVDALTAQYYGEERSLLHYSGVLGQLRFSTDPVALDVLSVRELERQRELADVPPVKTGLQLYQNAALLEIGVSDLRSIQVEIVR